MLGQIKRDKNCWRRTNTSNNGCKNSVCCFTVASPGHHLLWPFKTLLLLSSCVFQNPVKRSLLQPALLMSWCVSFRSRQNTRRKKWFLRFWHHLQKTVIWIFLSVENKQQSKYLMEWYEMAGPPNQNSQVMNPGRLLHPLWYKGCVGTARIPEYESSPECYEFLSRIQTFKVFLSSNQFSRKNHCREEFWSPRSFICDTSVQSSLTGEVQLHDVSISFRKHMHQDVEVASQCFCFFHAVKQHFFQYWKLNTLSVCKCRE